MKIELDKQTLLKLLNESATARELFCDLLDDGGDFARRSDLIPGYKPSCLPPPTPLPSADYATNKEIGKLFPNKIEMIKRARELKNWSLLEAKNYVDHYFSV